MCGIFGYISNDINKIDVNAFKLLGVLNETRGEQSCGIALNSDIFHGATYKDKKFRDFIKGLDLKPTEKPVLFGHTRKASSGIVNEENAHPFAFGTNNSDDGFAFIGAHNGTLYNHTELAETFGVELKERVSVNITREKIDSEVLLESIYVSKSFRPLNFYKGGAALVWYTPDTNEIYLFSGESKAYQYSHITEVERPLHVWIIDNNTFAFSSEGEPLEAIGAKEKEVFQIETNTVYIIKDGDFQNARKVKVSRINNTNKRELSTTRNYGHGGSNRLHETHRNTGSNNSGNPILLNPKTAEGNTANNQNSKTGAAAVDSYGLSVPQKPKALSTGDNQTQIILNNTAQEVLHMNDYKGRVYVRNLRFFRNGHFLHTGVYTYIPKYGLYKIGDTKQEAIEFYQKRKDSYFDSGTGDIIKIEDYLKIENREQKLRYIKITDHSMANFQDVYIYKGYRLQSLLDFISVKEHPHLYEDKFGIVNHATLSHITMYPVLCSTTPFFNKYIKDEKLVKDVTILGPNFDYSYAIENGILVRQINLPKSHLVGLDLYNKNVYDEEVAEYEIELEKKKQQKLIDITNLSNFLKDYSLKHASACTIFTITNDAQDEQLQLLAKDIIDHYETYEMECYINKNDVGVSEFYDNVKLSCKEYDTTLNEIVFEVVSYLNSLKKIKIDKGENGYQINTISAVISALLSYEQQFN